MQNNNFVSHIIRFILLVLFQVYVLNQILMFNLINPFIYIYFVFLLPFELPVALVTLLSFIIGFTVDAFLGTYAIHALASTVMGFFRSFILKLFASYDGYEINTYPAIKYYGVDWWLKYSFFMTLIHHTTLFFVEVFHFKYFFYTILKIIISTILSVLLMLFLQLLFHSKQENR